MFEGGLSLSLTIGWNVDYSKSIEVSYRNDAVSREGSNSSEWNIRARARDPTWDDHYEAAISAVRCAKQSELIDVLVCKLVDRSFNHNPSAERIKQI